MNDELETLWRAVIENREDLSARLVLADALLERGDSRGEIIHLQCDGHPTLRATDADEPSTVYMTESERQVALGERGHELVASSWRQWFPELSAIVRQHGSWFHEGMLYGIRPQGTRADWQTTFEDPVRAAACRRELATVRKVRGVVAGEPPPDAEAYMIAVAYLPHHPAWLDIDSDDISTMFYLLGEEWQTTGLRVGDVKLEYLPENFPAIEHLEFKPLTTRQRITADEAGALIAQVRKARAVFPRLRTIGFSDSWLQIRLTTANAPLVRTLHELGVVL